MDLKKLCMLQSQPDLIKGAELLLNLKHQTFENLLDLNDIFGENNTYFTKDSYTKFLKNGRKVSNMNQLSDNLNVDSYKLWTKNNDRTQMIYKKIEMQSATQDLIPAKVEGSKSVQNLSVNNMRFVCPIQSCTYEFEKKNHLESHLRRHFGLKPYVCSHKPCCTMAFSRKDELIRHYKCKHELDSAKNLSCPLCPRMFVRRDHLIKHAKRHVNFEKYMIPNVRSKTP